MKIEDVVQDIMAATSTQDKLQGFQRLVERLQTRQDLPFPVFTTNFFSEIVIAINPEKPRQLCLAGIKSLHHIWDVLVYTNATAIWALGESYLHSLIAEDLLNSLVIQLNASSEIVRRWAAECLLVIVRFSAEMKRRVKLCGIPQTFLKLIVNVPESLSLFALTELISFLYDLPMPSLRSSDTFQRLLQKFFSAGLGMFYSLGRLEFSPLLNRTNLSQLKPIVVSVLMESNKPKERLWASTLLKKYIQRSDMTSATREIVDSGDLRLLARSFSYNDQNLLAATLECVSLIGQGGISQCKAILESNIPVYIHWLFVPSSTLAEAACHAIRGLIKGGELVAIQTLERKGLLDRVLQVLKTDEGVEAACLTLLCVIQFGNRTHQRQLVQEKCIIRSLCHLLKKKTYHLALYQVLKDMKFVLETAQSLGLMRSISEVVLGDWESQRKIDQMLRSSSKVMVSLCKDLKKLLASPKR